MGYAHYTLPDGREAGYGFEATCDKDGCEAEIDRGLGYLCGEQPDGWRNENDFGCGNYYCDKHLADHDCPKSECGKWSAEGHLYCGRLNGHDGQHKDSDGQEFTNTEEDDQ